MQLSADNKPAAAEEPVLKNDPFASMEIPKAAVSENQEAAKEQFGLIDFNKPNSSEEEEKAQAAIDNILNASAANSNATDATQPAPLDLDTNKLFDFVGMSTNRTEAPANPFGEDAFTAPASDGGAAIQLNAQPASEPASAEAAPANNNAGSGLDAFM